MKDAGERKKRVSKRSPKGQGPLAKAKKRALQLAREQATDAEIKMVIQLDFGGSYRDGFAPREELREGVDRKWARAIEESRVAGRRDVLSHLHKLVTEGGEGVLPRDQTQAAIFLAREFSAVDKLPPEIKAVLKSLGAMTAKEQAEFVKELAKTLEG